MLSRPYAFGCILRVRTSTEFKAATVVRPSNHFACPSSFAVSFFVQSFL